MTDKISQSTVGAIAAEPSPPAGPAPATRAEPNPPPAPTATSKPKGKLRPASNFTPTSHNGIAPMLQVVSKRRSHIINRAEPSGLFPSAINYFQAVSITDQRMSTTKKFLETSESWHPVVSQYYACFLFTVQVLRTYNVSKIPDTEGLDFLSYVEEQLDLTQIPVPGTWAEYLRNITVVEAHHESFGNIHPVFPLLGGSPLTAGDVFSFPQSHRRILPNCYLALDQLIRYAQTGANTNSPRFINYANIFQLNPTTSDEAAQAKLAPQVSSWSHVSNSRNDVSLEFWSNATALLPNRADSRAGHHSGDVTDFFVFTGFRNAAGTASHSFFDVILQDMSSYCQFVKGSVPLSTIQSIGIGATIPVMYVQPSTSVRNYFFPSLANLRDDTNYHRSGHRLFPTTITYDMRHGDLTLEEIAEQYAKLTCLNTSFRDLPTQNGWNQPDETTVRDGPFWAITEYKVDRGVNPITGLLTNIPAYYHSPNALANK
uniref:Putative coat protein n=1 Tax=Rhizoctonia solani partitivirus virus 3 TaxID=2034993 RepID=A0A286SEQ7_9VIRU|nr:putative coat protein [Rhizoctonia solani partitivirus virus 3]